MRHLYHVRVANSIIDEMTQGAYWLGPAGRTAVAFEAEESPGSTETRCRITSGGGDPRESATESKPPAHRRG